MRRARLFVLASVSAAAWRLLVVFVVILVLVGSIRDEGRRAGRGMVGRARRGAPFGVPIGDLFVLVLLGFPAEAGGNAIGERDGNEIAVPQHDDGDIVGAAATERCVHQSVAGFLRRRGGGEKTRDLRIADFGGQSIGAEQDRIPVRQVVTFHIGGHLLSQPDPVGDDVAIAAAAGLLTGHVARFDLLPDFGVVFGDLAELAIAQQIGAAVARVPDRQDALLENGGDAGGSHAAQFRLLDLLVPDVAIGAEDAASHQAGRIRRSAVAFRQRFQHDIGQRFRHDGGRDIAPASAAHAVRDDDQRVERIEKVRTAQHGVAVLVLLSNSPDVRLKTDGDTQGGFFHTWR